MHKIAYAQDLNPKIKTAKELIFIQQRMIDCMLPGDPYHATAQALLVEMQKDLLLIETNNLLFEMKHDDYEPTK